MKKKERRAATSRIFTTSMPDQKVPELASIDASISSASLDQAKKLLAGDDTALASLKEEIRSLSDRRRRLLSDAGFPEDYLEQHFECPDCQDTGYVGTKKCHCFLKAIIDLFYTQSNLKGLLEQENFEHFNLIIIHPIIETGFPVRIPASLQRGLIRNV